jgi:hypothetical protein
MRSVTPFDATGTCRRATRLFSAEIRGGREVREARLRKVEPINLGATLVSGVNTSPSRVSSFVADVSQLPDSGWRLNHGTAVSDVDMPPLLVHAAVMHAA